MSKKRVENKKGISPLIATVIVIGFTIVLAAGVIYWGTGFFKNIQEKTSQGAALNTICAGDLAGLSISATKSGAAGVPPSILNLLIDNTKDNVDVYGVVVTLEGTSATQKASLVFSDDPANDNPTASPPTNVDDLLQKTSPGATSEPAIRRFNQGSLVLDSAATNSPLGVTGAVPIASLRTVKIKPFVRVATKQQNPNEVPSVCGNEVETTVLG